MIIPTSLRINVSSEDLVELARHRRWRETILFGAALVALFSTFGVSPWFAFLAADPDPDTRKAAIGILVSLVSALGGFLGGRAAK